MKYSHIEGVMGIDLDHLTSAEERAIVTQDTFLYRWLPTDTLKDSLFYFHDSLGMEWWQITIICPWVTKAFVVLPLAIFMQKTMEKIAPTQMEAAQKMKEIQIQFGHDRVLAGKKITELKKKFGYNPSWVWVRMIAPGFAQAPLHMSFFLTLRTMWPRFPDWKEGGALWFTDLAVADPTWALPVISGAMFLLNVELNSPKSGAPTNAMASMMNNGMRAMAFVMVPVFIMFPSGFTLYAVSNIAGFAVQSKLMKNDPFRKMVGLKPSAYLASVQAQNAQGPLGNAANFGKKKEESMKVTVGTKKVPKIKDMSLKTTTDEGRKYRGRRKKHE